MILGHLVPAGTGFKLFQESEVRIRPQALEALQAEKERVLSRSFPLLDGVEEQAAEQPAAEQPAAEQPQQQNGGDGAGQPQGDGALEANLQTPRRQRCRAAGSRQRLRLTPLPRSLH